MCLAKGLNFGLHPAQCRPHGSAESGRAVAFNGNGQSGGWGRRRWGARQLGHKVLGAGASYAEQAVLFESEATEELRDAETMKPTGDMEGFQEKGRVHTKSLRATARGTA